MESLWAWACWCCCGISEAVTKENNNSPVQWDITQPVCMMPQTQAGKDTLLKSRWKFAAQCWQQRDFAAYKSKRLFYSASHEWESGRPPPLLSLSLSLCLRQLQMHRSAEQQHILSMQNSNYFSPLGGLKNEHVYMSAKIWHQLDGFCFRWLVDFLQPKHE